MAEQSITKQVAEGQLILNFMTNTDKSTPITRQTVEILQSRVQLIDSYWEKVLDRHLELAPLAEELKQRSYFAEGYFSIFEDAYVRAKAELSRRTAILLPTTEQPRHSAPHGAGPISTLPKLALPKFSGNQLEWEGFKELFCSMVKDVVTLTPVVKLQYLLSSLEGPAAKRLANLEVIGANFTVAWDFLVKRYDNGRVRLSARMSRLLTLPPATHKAASEITRLLDEVEEAKRVMSAIGRPVQHWDDWFLEIVSSRLDSATREDWEKSLEGHAEFPTYDQLVDFLENRARSLENAKGN